MTTAEKRADCLRLMIEIKKWNTYPFGCTRKKLHKQIKFSYNLTRLEFIHARLESALNSAVMARLAQGL
jgi:hypothetical protein